MRLLCFALISSDWIENCPVSNRHAGMANLPGGTYLLFSCEKPNAPSRKKWRTRYCPSLHSRRPWFVLVYDPAEENLVKLLTFFPQKNLVKLSTFCLQIILSNIQFFPRNFFFKLSTFLFQLLLQWGVSPWCFKPLSNKTGRNEWWRRRPYTISKRTWVLSL